MPDLGNSHLKRFGPAHYQGHAIVHWIMTIADRQSGWLTPDFHHPFRFNLLHTCARYQLAFPLYCLMPDHLHLLICGLRPESDQLKALRFLRKLINHQLAETGHHLQQQAYDHILRPEERDPDAFSELLNYIRQNPARAGLCPDPTTWPYTSHILPGYPKLDLTAPGSHQKLLNILTILRS